MIHFFAEFPRTLTGFVDSWAPELRPRLQTVSYSRSLFLNPRKGACIFADLERLPAWKLSLGKRFVRRSAGHSSAPLILNDPNCYLGRFELLRLLHQRGINSFRVFRIDDRNTGVKFPVFLRSEIDHRGPITGLLRSSTELNRALSRLSFGARFRKRHLMIVEYCDCRDATEAFRKYSVMNINGTLIPRHILFSRDWVTKKPDLVSEATAAEEQEFMRCFPHNRQVAEVFQLAGVNYGRIDYGFVDGRIQVWEINTNPIVVPRRETVNPLRLPAQTNSARRIAEALLSLDRQA